MIDLLLADDQPLVRAGLRLILSAEPDLRVVAEAGDGGEAVSEAERTHPHVALMDVRMPGLDGIAATRAILAAVPAVRVLVLTTFDLDEYVIEAFRAGASGFLLKTAPPAQLVAAVHTVHESDALLAPASTRRLIEEHRQRGAEPPELAALTPRERVVLELLAQGVTNAEIADALVIEPSTVKSHVARVLAKLGLRDRVQAVVFAYDHGIVRPARR